MIRCPHRRNGTGRTARRVGSTEKHRNKKMKHRIRKAAQSAQKAGVGLGGGKAFRTWPRKDDGEPNFVTYTALDMINRVLTFES
jgi:hypothetical protein